MPEHSDQQRHRNQRGFPEEVKQEQIEREENADQSGFQHQQQNEKLFDPLMDGFPGNQHAQRGKEGGQHYQPQREAVNPNVVMNVGGGNPGDISLKLETRLITTKMRRQVQRQDKSQ